MFRKTNEIGKIRSITGSTSIQAGGQTVITLDIQGPVSQTKIWFLDSVSLIGYLLGLSIANMIIFDISPFFLIPSQQGPLADPANYQTAPADVQSRQIAIPTDLADFSFEAQNTTIAIVQIAAALFSSFPWPYGYTLRVIIAVANPNFGGAQPTFAAGSFINVAGLVREIDLSAC